MRRVSIARNASFGTSPRCPNRSCLRMHVPLYALSIWFATADLVNSGLPMPLSLKRRTLAWRFSGSQAAIIQTFFKSRTGHSTTHHNGRSVVQARSQPLRPNIGARTRAAVASVYLSPLGTSSGLPSRPRCERWLAVSVDVRLLFGHAPHDLLRTIFSPSFYRAKGVFLLSHRHLSLGFSLDSASSKHVTAGSIVNDGHR